MKFRVLVAINKESTIAMSTIDYLSACRLFGNEVSWFKMHGYNTESSDQNYWKGVNGSDTAEVQITHIK